MGRTKIPYTTFFCCFIVQLVIFLSFLGTKTAYAHIRGNVLEKEDVTPVVLDSVTKWVDGTMLHIEGKGWTKTSNTYTRFPLEFKSLVRGPVWGLSAHSAGVVLHFTASNTKFIKAKWKTGSNVFFPHMTPLSMYGLDLYVKLDDSWQWVGPGKPKSHGAEFEYEAFLKNYIPENGKFEYLLYLPLYSSLKEIKLGFSPDVLITKPQARGNPLVFYGSSITQGCSASRPGMTYPAILGRRLDLPVINLGFSGNGTMDPEFADILAEISASAYVIDCLPNMKKMSAKEISDRTLTLVKKLRSKRPAAPIILVEDRTFSTANFTRRTITNKGRIGLKKAYRQLLKEGFKKILYIPGDGLLGYDNEATIDGSHPSDLGMFRYSEVMEPVLRSATNRK